MIVLVKMATNAITCFNIWLAWDQVENYFGILVVEEVTTPRLGLFAARTRNLVHYEVHFPTFLRDDGDSSNGLWFAGKRFKYFYQRSVL